MFQESAIASALLKRVSLKLCTKNSCLATVGILAVLPPLQ
jgi:hypothetical protein